MSKIKEAIEEMEFELPDDFFQRFEVMFDQGHDSSIEDYEAVRCLAKNKMKFKPDNAFDESSLKSY